MSENALTLLRMGLFGAVQGWVRGGRKGVKKPPLCTYPTMMKLGAVIPYLKDSKNI